MITFSPWYSKTVFKNEVRQNLRPVKFFKDSLVKSTYTNMACKHFFANFQWILKNLKNIYRGGIDDFRVKRFTSLLFLSYFIFKDSFVISNIRGKTYQLLLWISGHSCMEHPILYRGSAILGYALLFIFKTVSFKLLHRSIN